MLPHSRLTEDVAGKNTSPSFSEEDLMVYIPSCCPSFQLIISLHMGSSWDPTRSLKKLADMFPTSSFWLILTVKPIIQLLPGRSLPTLLVPQLLQLLPDPQIIQLCELRGLAFTNPLGPHKITRQFYLDTQTFPETTPTGSAQSEQAKKPQSSSYSLIRARLHIQCPDFPRCYLKVNLSISLESVVEGVSNQSSSRNLNKCMGISHAFEILMDFWHTLSTESHQKQREWLGQSQGFGRQQGDQDGLIDRVYLLHEDNLLTLGEVAVMLLSNAQKLTLIVKKNEERK